MRRGDRDQRSVTLNASGYGFVQWTATLADWTLRTVSVSGTSSPEPVAKLYIGQLGVGYFQDATSTGNADLSDTQYEIRDGTSFFVEWTGGQPGAVMRAAITYDSELKYVTTGFRGR